MLNILKWALHCNSNNSICLPECKEFQYRSPYIDRSKSKFWYRINNYKSTYRKFQEKCVEKDMTVVIKKNQLKQKLYYKSG